MKRVYVRVICAAGALLLLLVPVCARAVPDAPAAYCGLSVRLAEPLDASDGAARTWAFALSVQRRGGSGFASGGLHVEAGTDAYDVAFSDAVVESLFDAKTKPTPLVYTFPQPLKVDLAYVSSLDVPAPGPCVPFGAWAAHVPDAGLGEVPPPVRLQSAAEFLRSAKSVAPIAVGRESHTLVQVCTKADVAPRTVHAAVPHFPQDVPRIDYTTDVLVAVGASGLVEETAVYYSSNFEKIDALAQQAARASLFAAPTIKCRSIGGSYVFVVHFEAN